LFVLWSLPAQAADEKHRLNGTLPAKGATVYALPMKIAGGSGAPLRIFGDLAISAQERGSARLLAANL